MQWDERARAAWKILAPSPVSDLLVYKKFGQKSGFYQLFNYIVTVSSATLKSTPLISAPLIVKTYTIKFNLKI